MYEMEIQLNLDKICRLCLEEKGEQLLDVFGNESNLRENILRATTVKIEEGDDLPAHVCQQCVSLVNVIVNFQRKCVVADLALHHYVRKCICNKEHKECEAVKLYPKDPLQLTQVIKTEGGSCQIKSETRVFTLQESREEVITGFIEENAVNPRVSIKAEESESTTRATKSVKVRCNSATVKVHKRRRRKGHRWKLKKQSSANRKTALSFHLQTAGVREHVQSIGSLQNTEAFTPETSIQKQKVSQNSNILPANKMPVMEKSAQNRMVCPTSSSFTATEEGHPNTMSSNTSTGMQTAERGYVPKTRISRRSNSVVINKTLLLKDAVQKRRALSSSNTVTLSSVESVHNQNSGIIIANKKLVKASPQNRKASQNSKLITANKKTVEASPQNKRASQNSNINTANKTTASKESQQNIGLSDISKIFLANKVSISEQPALNQTIPQSNSSVPTNQKLLVDEHTKIRTRNSFIKKLSKEETTQNSCSTASQKPKIEKHLQIQSVSPTRTPLKKKPASEKCLPIQKAQQSCSSVQANQKLETNEHVQLQTRLLSNKKPSTENSTSNQNLPQRGKSLPASQKLLTKENLQSQRVSPARKSLKNKAVTEESTLDGNVPQSIKSVPANQKLVTREHVQMQKISSVRKSPKVMSITEESATIQKFVPSCNSLTDKKLVREEHIQIRKASPTRNSLRNKPAAVESTLNQNIPQSSKTESANQKLVVNEHAQRVSSKWKSVSQDRGTLPDVNSFPTTKSDTMLPSSKTFQAEEDFGQQSCDMFPANEKPVQNTSDNTFPNKRKNSETESSVPEPSKKQKTQENDRSLNYLFRLMKLVIQVEGNKLCCSQCDSWFEDVENLKRHLEELHKKRVVRWHTVIAPGPEKDPTPLLLCATCGKQFTSQRLFASHKNQKACS